MFTRSKDILGNYVPSVNLIVMDLVVVVNVHTTSSFVSFAGVTTGVPQDGCKTFFRGKLYNPFLKNWTF